jgi:Na+/H+ antiporter NhaC
MERASAVYKSHESAEHRLAIIVDCSGTRPRATIPPEEKGGMSSSSAKDLSTVMQLYYAHSMGVCLILGAGFTITTTYKALSCIMPEETRNKVKFMSRSSAKAYLAKNVDPEVLISDLGGRFPYTTYDSQR